MDHWTAFPESGIVVILGDLLEAELLIVIRPDPFGPVDRALLQRGIDVTAGELLWHDANFLQHLASNAADTKFKSGEIGDRLDLLAKPATHLGTGVAARESDHIGGLLEELVADFHAAALIPP